MFISKTKNCLYTAKFMIVFIIKKLISTCFEWTAANSSIFYYNFIVILKWFNMHKCVQAFD